MSELLKDKSADITDLTYRQIGAQVVAFGSAVAVPFLLKALFASFTLQIAAFTALAFFLLAFSIALLVVGERSWMMALLIWCVALYMVLFPDKTSPLPLLFLGIIFSVTYITVRGASREFENQFAVRFRGTFQSVFNALALAVALFLVLQTLSVSGLVPHYEEFISRDTYNAYLWNPIQPVLVKIFPQLPLDKPIENILGLKGNPLAGLLLPQNVNLKMTVSDMVYERMRSFYDNLWPELKLGALVVLSFLILISIYTLAKYLGIVLGIIAGVAFSLLRLTGIIQVRFEQKPKEVVSL